MNTPNAFIGTPLEAPESKWAEVLHNQLQTQIPNYYIITGDYVGDKSCGNWPVGHLNNMFAERYSIEHRLYAAQTTESSETLSRIRGYQALLEPMTPDAPPNGMTICVPLAILKEDEDTIDTMMKQIEKAAAHVENGVNVWVWANAKYTDENESPVVREQASSKYSRLRELLAGYESDALRITTALETLSVSDISMSIIRRNYMEALIGQVVDGTIPMEHPVMWIDADTTYLSKNIFSSVKNQLSQHVLDLCHPDVDYSFEWVKGVPAREMDEASKAFLIDEMARRKAKRVAIDLGANIAERSYAEESGLSFTMISYMLASGVDAHDSINESARLIDRLSAFFRRGPEIFDLPHDVQTLYDPRPTGVPRETRDPRDHITWLNNVTIHTSGRRRYHRILSHGATTLMLRGSKARGPYELFTDLPEVPLEPIPIDPVKLFGALTRPRGAGTKSAQQVVSRMLANKNLYPPPKQDAQETPTS